VHVGKNLMVVGNFGNGKNQGELESVVSQKRPFPETSGRFGNAFSHCLILPVKTR